LILLTGLYSLIFGFIFRRPPYRSFKVFSKAFYKPFEKAFKGLLKAFQRPSLMTLSFVHLHKDVERDKPLPPPTWEVRPPRPHTEIANTLNPQHTLKILGTRSSTPRATT
jgi:hypothetical protein